MGYESNKDITCPRCGTQNIIPIMYGSPSAKAWKQREAGIVATGGSPSFALQRQGDLGPLANCYCKDCKHRWDEKPWPWLCSTTISNGCKVIPAY